jgi:uncharacterized protein (DUF2342 family)
MKLISTLVGLDAKMRQYEQGEQFIETIEADMGKEFLANVWRGPEWLPDLAEIREPSRWVDRVQSGDPRRPAPAAAR